MRARLGDLAGDDLLVDADQPSLLDDARSPTYSPSTWNATGRAARKVSASSSWRLTTWRPAGPPS
ncbi:MAG TPA: hypothetical protein VLK34_03085, partial [Nocardioidaceae bacterium]|nr:hypothetical protein [Nocardioidaceae bacterium]